MKIASKIGTLILLCTLAVALAANAAPKKILVVSVAKSFKHSAIPTGEKVLAEIGQKSGDFTVDYIHDSEGDQGLKEKFTVENLKNYDAVIFNNTQGDLALPDEAGFLNWLKSGKGFIGIHAATDTLRAKNPRTGYSEMIGAEFKGHPPGLRDVEAINYDPKHPATKHLGPVWKVKDEIYLVDRFDRSQVHNLLGLEKHPADGTPGYFPIAWCKQYGKGRVFYTSLGHDEKELWNSEVYQKHLLGGIRWALGLEKGNAKPQAPMPPTPPAPPAKPASK